LVTFGSASNFNTDAIRSKILKEIRKKSKIRPAKKEGPSIKEKMEML
jgi:hypothetical protein